MNDISNYGNISDSILELVDLKNTPPNSIFLRYVDKTEIGKQIFKELVKRFKAPNDMADTSAKMGFYMDDASKEIGLLSQTQGLQALLLLTSEFNLDFDAVYEGTATTVENGEKVSLTIRMIMDLVISDIINRLSKKSEKEGLEEKRYVFDSSPYTSEVFDYDYAYIDCITWVIPTFLLVLKYHVKKEKPEICRYEKEMISIIKAGIAYLNAAYIKPSEDIKNKLTCGWNFTKDCEEPSLYFTFAVSECYVDLFDTFSEYLEDVEALRDRDINGFPLDPKVEERINAKQAQYDQMLSEKSFDDIEYKKGELAFFGNDTYNELKRIYTLINDGETGFNSPYGELETHCKEVSGMIWGLVKDKFADYFYYNDLHATITEDDLRMSTTNDALFNSVYIINILLDTGLDEEIKKKIKKAEMILKASKNVVDEAVSDNLTDEERSVKEKELLEYTREYNNLLETCQLALQKAFRAYENLKNESREYIVDQFLVGFNEKLVKLESKVRELRKLRIRVFSLLPLFVKTNSVISEYLVRYPQNSMKKYLGYILDNRYIEHTKNKALVKKWIWEQDGYFSASNYYYVSALGEFYKYYDEYERKYIDPEYDLAQVIKEYREELEKDDGDIGKLNKELEVKEKEYNKVLAQKDAEISVLNEKIDNFDTPIEDAVKKVIAEQVKEVFPKLITEFMKDASSALVAQHMDNKKADVQYRDFKNAIVEFMLSMFADKIADQAKYGYMYSNGDSGNKHTALENYEQLSKDIVKDINEIVANNVESISRFVGAKKTSILGKLVEDNILDQR